MEVTLPSGNTAQFRDVLLRGDIRAARKGMVFLINADGSRRSDGSLLDTVTGHMIRSMMISWSFSGQPLPSQASTDELAQQILDQLPEDDYAALEKAVGPWVERVMRMSRQENVLVHTATGVRVEPVSPDDAARLLESGEFTREAGADDPKPGSAGSGTSSSASPALPGPATAGTPPTSS